MLPELTNIQRETIRTTEFGGLNRRPVASANEFEEIVNLCADAYPALTTRAKRNTFNPFDEQLAPNTKLYYNKELIRLIPTDGYDKLNFGGQDIPDWQTLRLSRFADLPTLLADENGKPKTNATVNDISIASIGAYVLFMPYRAWFNVEDWTCGSVGFEHDYKYEEPSVTDRTTIGVYPVFADYTAPNRLFEGQTPTGGAQTNDMRYYLHGLWRYSNNEWVHLTSSTSGGTVPGYCYQITVAPKTAFPDGLTDGEQVFIECTYDFNGHTVTKKISGTVEGYDASHEGYAAFYIKDDSDPGRAFIEKCIDTTAPSPSNKGIYPLTTTITKQNSVEALRFITALDNRIWGCDKSGHKIMCCEQGNIFNWSTAQAGEKNPWDTTVGEGKEWTGAITYDKTVYFFKKDRVFKMSGSRPSNYGYREISIRGCYDNASIAVVADRLMYMGADGIYEYTGSYPTRVSDKVAGTWRKCVAGAFRNNYYCTRTNLGNKKETMHYNLEAGAWYEDGSAPWYSAIKGEESLYYVYDQPVKLTVHTAVTSGTTLVVDGEVEAFVSFPADDNKIATATAASYNGTADTTTLTLDNNVTYAANDVIQATRQTWGTFIPLALEREREDDYNDVPEGDIEWSAVTGDQMSDIPAKKYVAALDLSIKLGEGAEMAVFIQYDYTGNWIPIKTITRANKDTDTIRFVPRRCRHYRLKFVGKGEFTLFSMTKTVEEAREIG